MTTAIGRSGLVALLSFATVACGGGAGADKTVTPETPASSFDRIQTTVFANNCTNCHSAGSQFASQSGLILDRAVAYRNLINVAAVNDNARTDGLQLVVPGNSAKSLLYQKLLLWDPNHVRDYGAPMPLGDQSLSVGQLEFVRRWIDAGAPQTGEVADANLLNDVTRPVFQPFSPLVPPQVGYQLKIEPFDVAAHFERELFVSRKLNNPAPIYITRVETKMRLNSHHLLLYTFSDNIPKFIVPQPDQIRDIRNADGGMNILNMLPMGYHVFFAGSMTPTGGYQFPPGIALELPANATLDLNSHYVNTSGASLPGEIYANLYTVDKASVQKVVRTLFMTNDAFVLPPGQRTTITRTFNVSAVTTIIMLTSHMHMHGEKFLIRIAGGARNGETVYESTSWSDPRITTFDQPIVLQPGEGLTSEVTYNNTTAKSLGFGLTSEDEMDIILGYAY